MKRNIIVISLIAALAPLALAHAAPYLSAYATATAEAWTGGGSGAALLSPEDGVLASGNVADIDAVRASSTKSVDGQLTAENHRHVVAEAARSLIQIAGREGLRLDLSERLRAVAVAERSSEATTTEAIEKVAFRNSFISFFLGRDYRDLTLIRNTIADRSHTLSELRDIEADVENPSDRAAIQTQIDALAGDQTVLEKFVSAHSRVGILGFLSNLAALGQKSLLSVGN